MQSLTGSRVVTSDSQPQCCLRRHYASLVEVLVAVLLLTILAVAAGSYITHTRTMMVVQRDKRAALSVAEARLEDLRASRANFFDQLSGSSSGTYYVVTPDSSEWIKDDGEDWDLTPAAAGEASENVEINRRQMAMTTTAECLDVDGFGDTCDYVAITVRVRYRLQSEDEVMIQTRMARPL